MEVISDEPSKPGDKTVIQAGDTALRLVVTDQQTGMKVDFVVITGQACTITAGTSSIKIERIDLEDQPSNIPRLR